MSNCECMSEVVYAKFSRHACMPCLVSSAARHSMQACRLYWKCGIAPGVLPACLIVVADEVEEPVLIHDWHAEIRGTFHNVLPLLELLHRGLMLGDATRVVGVTHVGNDRLCADDDKIRHHV